MDRESVEKSNSVHGHIIRFLIKEGEPKTTKEIVAHVVKVRKIEGKTPQNTIRGILQRSKFIRKNVYAKFELIDDEDESEDNEESEDEELDSSY